MFHVSYLFPRFRVCIHLIRIRIQHFRLNTDPDPIRIQVFFDQKLKKITGKKNFFFKSRTTIYLSLGLHKGRPSYKISFQLSKENIQHFRTWTFLIIFYFCVSFLPSWIRIRIRIWIRIHWPDWIRIRNPAYYNVFQLDGESWRNSRSGSGRVSLASQPNQTNQLASQSNPLGILLPTKVSYSPGPETKVIRNAKNIRYPYRTTGLA